MVSDLHGITHQQLVQFINHRSNSFNREYQRQQQQPQQQPHQQQQQQPQQPQQNNIMTNLIQEVDPRLNTFCDLMGYFRFTGDEDVEFRRFT